MNSESDSNHLVVECSEAISQQFVIASAAKQSFWAGISPWEIASLRLLPWMACIQKMQEHFSAAKTHELVLAGFVTAQRCELLVMTL
jgi:hypothetical protein